MMKKLLVLALVLAVSTLASANIVGFELDASAVVGAGNTVKINLVADGDASGFLISGVSDGAAGGSVANLTIGSGLSTVQGGFVDNYIKGGVGYLFDSVAASASPAVAADSVLFSFDYTISAAWDGTTDIVIAPLASGTLFYYLDGGEQSFAVDPSTVNIATVDTAIAGVTIPGAPIPEPATLAILGLGGLLIRRKK